jgi:hypothetical protein
MKILCCCYGGNSRSVSLAMLLKINHGQRDVLAVGLGHTSEPTKRMLFDWADVVVVVGERELFELLPHDVYPKTVWVNIGPDRWCNPTHPDLTSRLLPVLDQWLKTGAVGPYTDPALLPEAKEQHGDPSQV